MLKLVDLFVNRYLVNLLLMDLLKFLNEFLLLEKLFLGVWILWVLFCSSIRFGLLSVTKAFLK